VSLFVDIMVRPRGRVNTGHVRRGSESPLGVWTRRRLMLIPVRIRRSVGVGWTVFGGDEGVSESNGGIDIHWGQCGVLMVRWCRWRL
jgi:hypothetical protein